MERMEKMDGVALQVTLDPAAVAAVAARAGLPVRLVFLDQMVAEVREEPPEPPVLPGLSDPLDPLVPRALLARPGNPAELDLRDAVARRERQVSQVALACQGTMVARGVLGALAGEALVAFLGGLVVREPLWLASLAAVGPPESLGLVALVALVEFVVRVGFPAVASVAPVVPPADLAEVLVVLVVPEAPVDLLAVDAVALVVPQAPVVLLAEASGWSNIAPVAVTTAAASRVATPTSLSSATGPTLGPFAAFGTCSVDGRRRS